MMEEQSYVTVLSTESGRVAVNRQKNRVYMTCEHEQKEELDSSRVLEELHELKHYLSHGFTMLFDARQGRIEHEKTPELFCDMMNLLLEGGLCKLAEIHSGRAIFLPDPDCQQSYDVQHAVFAGREEAEAWLDASDLE